MRFYIMLYILCISLCSFADYYDDDDVDDTNATEDAWAATVGVSCRF